MADFTNIFPNAAQLDTTNALLAIIAANSEGGMGITSFDSVSRIVRLGLAPKVFPVGYEFSVTDSDTGLELPLVVLGHDHHKAADKNLKHTMTLGFKQVCSQSGGAYKPVQFSAPQALYYAEDGLGAGTYHFALPADYDTAGGGGKTLSFTVSRPVPAGGVVVFPWNASMQSTDVRISTYESNAAAEAIESDLPVTEGANGAYLGTADGETENMNLVHRIRYGSNNDAQSAVFQWLNSDAEAGSVWVPKTKFDRPPSWAATYNGFLHGLPADFLEAVQPAIIPCRTNGVYEVDSLDGTAFAINQTYDLKCRFFLLSRPEMYGTWDDASLRDGELLEYYAGATDAERILRDATGMARNVWLRSPYPTYSYRPRRVVESGALNHDGARYVHGVTAACIIA